MVFSESMVITLTSFHEVDVSMVYSRYCEYVTLTLLMVTSQSGVPSIRSNWNAPENVLDAIVNRLVFPLENVSSNDTEIQVVDESVAEKVLFSMMSDFSNSEWDQFTLSDMAIELTSH